MSDEDPLQQPAVTVTDDEIAKAMANYETARAEFTTVRDTLVSLRSEHGRRLAAKEAALGGAIDARKAWSDSLRDNGGKLTAAAKSARNDERDGIDLAKELQFMADEILLQAQETEIEAAALVEPVRRTLDVAKRMMAEKALHDAIDAAAPALAKALALHRMVDPAGEAASVDSFTQRLGRALKQATLPAWEAPAEVAGMTAEADGVSKTLAESPSRLARERAAIPERRAALVQKQAEELDGLRTA